MERVHEKRIQKIVLHTGLHLCIFLLVYFCQYPIHLSSGLGWRLVGIRWRQRFHQIFLRIISINPHKYSKTKQAPRRRKAIPSKRDELVEVTFITMVYCISNCVSSSQLYIVGTCIGTKLAWQSRQFHGKMSFLMPLNSSIP
jgi:hypothetical protein